MRPDALVCLIAMGTLFCTVPFAAMFGTYLHARDVRRGVIAEEEE